MIHTFYSNEILWRQFECVLVQNNDLQWPADGQASALSFPYKSGTNTSGSKSWKIWLVWREIRIKNIEFGSIHMYVTWRLLRLRDHAPWRQNTEKLVKSGLVDSVTIIDLLLEEKSVLTFVVCSLSVFPLSGHFSAKLLVIRFQNFIVRQSLLCTLCLGPYDVSFSIPFNSDSR